MIATLAVWALGFGAITAAAVAAGYFLVWALDPLIGYHADREDGRTPWPDDHRPTRPLRAVGPGRPTLHDVAHGRR